MIFYIKNPPVTSLWQNRRKMLHWLTGSCLLLCAGLSVIFVGAEAEDGKKAERVRKEDPPHSVKSNESRRTEVAVFKSNPVRDGTEKFPSPGSADGDAGSVTFGAASEIALLDADITRLTEEGIRGSGNLRAMLDKAISTPDSSQDDIEFMTAYHRARAAAPAIPQEN